MLDQENNIDAVWPCEPATHDSDGRKSLQSSRRKRSIIQFLITLFAGTLFLFTIKHVWLGAALYSLSGLMLLGILFFPRLDDVLRQFGIFLGRVAGVALTFALLTPFFYLCFVPGRIMLILLGKDPMQRKWQPGAPSYWSARSCSTDPQRYRKMY